jgi:thiol-disulfide isomerase/thioredoxin
MTSKARSSRREAARARERSSRNRWLLPAIGGGVVLVAAVLAIAFSGSLAPDGGSTARPSGTAASVAPGTEVPVISGALLPEFQNPTGDAAVGMPAPTVTGAAFDGSATAIAADGRPKIVVFLAHWCPVCQAEVPVVQDWIDAGAAPDDVDIISVATGIDPGRPNYPPDAWLAREGWTSPVIVDPTNAVSDAYGLTAYPFWTFIGADGTVRARATGKLGVSDLQAYVDGLRAGS